MVACVTDCDLVAHPHIVVHEFGARCFLRCIWCTGTAHRAVTFLECIDAEPAPAEAKT